MIKIKIESSSILGLKTQLEEVLKEITALINTSSIIDEPIIDEPKPEPEQLESEPEPEQLESEPKPEPEPEPEPVQGETDSENIPWDVRIHSSKKTRTKSDVWKLMRIPKRFNGDEEAWHIYINDVKSELLIDKLDESENPAAHLDDPNVVFGNSTPDPIVDSAVEPLDFDGVLALVRDVDPMTIMAICEQMQIVNIFQLQNDQTRIPEFAKLLRLIGKVA